MSRVRVQRDRGTVLPLVLVLVVVLGTVVAAIATYTSTSLRYGQVVESRNDRHAAADGALRDAIERLRIGAASAEIQCPVTSLGSVTRDFPIDINGTTTVVECSHVGSGASSLGQWALMLTGRGIGSAPILSSSGAGGSTDKRISGPVWIYHEDVGLTSADSNDSPFDLQAKVTVLDGDVYFPDDSNGDGSNANGGPANCQVNGDRVTIDRWTNSGGTGDERLTVSPAPRSGVCLGGVTSDLPKIAPPVPSVELAGLPSGDVDGTDYDINGDPATAANAVCREFTPGVYTSIQLPAGRSAYFASGNYVFDDVVLTIDKQGNDVPVVTFGYPDLANGITQSIITNASCQPRIVADAPNAPGATVYMQGQARINVQNGSIEMLPRYQGGDDWVSIQAYGSTLTGGPSALPILRTAPGAGQEGVFRGWIWAPEAWIDLPNVTGQDADVRLSGGTAVARVHIGANATAGGLEFSVTQTPARSRYRLVSTATKDGASTSIVALVEFGTNPTRVAVLSQRVDNI